MSAINCYPTVDVHIHTTTYAEEISWSIDGSQPTTYTDAQDNDAHFHPVVLPAGDHTFTYVDSYNDGWHRGYWEILDACGGRIGGGEVDGLVEGSGGTFAFAGSAQCCVCEASAGCVEADLPNPIACVDCPAGWFSETAGVLECSRVCVAGSYSATASAGATSAASDCVNCPAGKSDADSDPATVCANCEPGKYSDVVGATACIVCSVGSFSVEGSTAASDCVNCPAGKSDEDQDPATACTDCPTGYYSETVGSTECTPFSGDCTAGSISATAVTGATAACVSCPVGKSDAGSDPATVCANCEPGKYSDVAGAIACIACPAGSFSEVEGSSAASDCVNCAAGTIISTINCYPTVNVHIHTARYAAEISWSIDGGQPTTYTSAHDNDAHFHPIMLPAGDHTFTYADSTYATSYGDGWHGGYWEILDACGGRIGGGEVDGLVEGSGGSFAFAGSAQCCVCEASTGCIAADLPSPGPPMCVDCPAGRFSETAGVLECSRVCVAGSYSATSSAGATSAASDCVNCPAGKFDADSDPATACTDCPTGYYSQTGASMECTPASGACTSGFVSATVITGATAACVSCPVGKSDADSDPATVCANCEPGKYSDVVGGTACIACHAGSLSVEGSSAASDCVDCPAGKSTAAPAPAGVTWEMLSDTKCSSMGPCELTSCSADDIDAVKAACTADASCIGFTVMPIEGGAVRACTNIDAESRSGATAYIPLAPDEDQDPRCTDCPTGYYSETVASTECTPFSGACTAGSVSATVITGATAACVSCPVGKSDADQDPATACTNCAAGQNSDAIGGTECMCDVGTHQYARTDCYPTVDVHIHSAGYASHNSWSMDGGETTTYTPTNGPTAHVHPVVLPAGDHNFTYADSHGDGWHGGYWEILNACGGRIGGGEVDGRVEGSGGSFAFAGSAQCCTCEASAGCVAADLPSPIACVDCPAGRFSNAVGATECAGACAAGSHSTPGSSDCANCLAGKSDADRDPATACTNCAAGRYSDAVGVTECAGTCAVGSHSPGFTWEMLSDTKCSILGTCQLTSCSADDIDAVKAACTADASCIGFTIIPTVCNWNCNSREILSLRMCTTIDTQSHSGATAYIPTGSMTASDCADCPAGKSDADLDPATACTDCVVGRSSEDGIGECRCDAGTYEYVRTDCYPTVDVHIHTAMHAAEISWSIDSGEPTTYTRFQNNDAHFHSVVLPVGDHTFTYAGYDGKLTQTLGHLW
jgi:hypothetical protein